MVTNQAIGQSSISLPQDTSAKVKLFCVAAVDNTRVRWSTSPTMATIAGIDAKGSGTAEKTMDERSITGLAANTRYYFQAGYALAAAPGTWAEDEIKTFMTQPLSTSTIAGVITSDIHDMQLVLQVLAGLTNCERVYQQTLANIGRETSDAGKPSIRLDLGDMLYALYNTGNRFPIVSTGAPAGGADQHTAKSQQDVDYLLRLWRARDPTKGDLPFMSTHGNHDGVQHWCANAINGLGASGDTSVYALAGKANYIGLPGATGIFSGSATGRYFAYRWGPCLMIHLDPYVATVYDGGALSHPLPISPSVSSNPWTLGQAQWDWLFHADTGILSNPSGSWTWAVVCCHHLVGGRWDGSPPKYGRGGARYVSAEHSGQESYEWGAGAGWTNPYVYGGDYAALGIHHNLVKHSKAQGYRVVVLKGHDHAYVRELAGGISYITCPQPAVVSAESSEEPYGDGFLGAGAYGTSAEANQFRTNGPGHLSFQVSPTAFNLRFRASLVEGLTRSDGSPLTQQAKWAWGVKALDGNGVQNNGVVDHICLAADTVAWISKRILETGTRARDDTRDWNGHTLGDATDAEAAHELNRLGPGDVGHEWYHHSSGVGANAVHLAVRDSILDGARCIATCTPPGAGGALVSQGAIVNVGCPDMEVRVQGRLVASTDNVGLVLMFRAKRGVSLHYNATSEKGWMVRSKSGASGEHVRLHRDLPMGSAEVATASPDFLQTPTFDEFLVVQAVGRRILVWTETTAGVRTLRIDYTMTLGEWQETIAVPGEYVYAGLVGRQANIAGHKTSNPMEFRGFEVKRLPGGGGMAGPGGVRRPTASRADRNRMSNPALSTPGGRVDQTGRPGGCDAG